MLWNGKWLTVAPSFLDFASMASSRTLEYFQTLDPDFARLRQEQKAIAAESYDAWRRRRRWWRRSACARAPKLTGLRPGSWERSWFRSPCAYLTFCLRQGGWASLFSLAAW